MKFIVTKPMTCTIANTLWVIVPGETFEELFRENGSVVIRYKNTVAKVKLEDYQNNYKIFKGENYEENKRLYH